MNSKAIIPYSCLSEAIYARVGRRGIAGWLYVLADHFSIPRDVILPTKIVEEYNVSISGNSLSLTFRHPHADYDDNGDKQRWYLFNAVFLYRQNNQPGWVIPAVLNLDVDNATPESIIEKAEFDTTPLTDDDIARGYRRQSIFMDDARVVEITWREGMKGIERILVTFVGKELDYIETQEP